MEKTLFFEISNWIKELKDSNKKSIKVAELSTKFEQLIKDKLTVDINMSTYSVKFEGLNQEQSDALSKIFESYVREYKEKQRSTPPLNKTSEFELVADWNENTVKTEEQKDSSVKPKTTKQRKSKPKK